MDVPPFLDQPTVDAHRRFLDDWEHAEWCKRMDDHYRRRMRELEEEFRANRSEAIRRAIWGQPRPEPTT